MTDNQSITQNFLFLTVLNTQINQLSILLVCLLFSFTSTEAQTYSVEQESASSGSILNAKDQIVGYYIYYLAEKIKRKDENKSIIFKMLDQNLELLYEKKIRMGVDAVITECKYNGNSIALKTIDLEKEKFKIIRFDSQGKKLRTKSISMSPAEIYGIGKHGMGYNFMGGGNDFVPSPDKGYFFYGTKSEKKFKKMRYEIRFVSDKDSVATSWKAKGKIPSDDKEAVVASYLGQNEKALFSTVLHFRYLKSKNASQSVVMHDINAGTKIATLKFSKLKKKPYIHSMYEQNGFTYLVGEFYGEDDKMLTRARNKGIVTIKIDEKGEILNTNYLPWDGKVSKHIEMSKKGEVKGEGSLFFHDFIPTNDGDVYGIAEVFNKQISGGKVLGNILTNVAAAAITGSTNGTVQAYGGGNSNTEIKIKDMYVFHLDAEGNLKEAIPFEKDSHGASIYDFEMDFTNEQILGKFVKIQDKFGYRFTHLNSNNSKFWVGYAKYASTSGKKSDLSCGAITYENGKLTQEDFEIESSANFKSIYPAKPGYILLSEYFKKEKRYDFRLIRLNE